MQKEGTTITHALFENNLDFKLKEHSFLDDIGPLLSHDLKQSHSSPIITERGDFNITGNADTMVTEGWNLVNAAEEIKSNILVHLPK